MQAEIVSTVNILSGWIRVDRLLVKMPDGAQVERHLEDHGHGVAVLPYDPVRRVALLVSQPRPAVLLDGCDLLLELIAGRLDNIDPADRVREEALEEAGVRLRELELLVCLWSMPSVSTERLHVYLSVYDENNRISSGGGLSSEHENIIVHEISIASLGKKAETGQIQDAKTMIAIQALQIRRPELFI